MAGRSDIEAGSAYVRVYMKQTALQRGIKDLQRKLKRVGEGFTQLGRTAMVAGGVIVGAISAAAAKFAGFGEQLDKMSGRTGVGVESLSELKFAAEQSGASLEDLGAVFLKMNRRFGRVTADAGSVAQVDAIESLGLSIEQLSRLDAEGRFLAIAEAMAKYGDNAAAAGLAQRIFGTGVDALLPLIFSGADGIAKLRKEARELGLTMSEEDAAAAAGLADAMNEMRDAANAAYMAIGKAVAPTVTDLAERLAKVAVDAQNWIKANSELIVGFLKVGSGAVAVGAALVGIGTVLGSTATAIGVVSTAATFLAANPMVLLAGAVVAAAVVYFTSETAKMSDAMSTARQEADKKRAADVSLMRELRGLADKQRPTTIEMDRAETVLSELEKRHGALGAAIQRTTGQIVGMGQAWAIATRKMQNGAIAQLHLEALEAEENIARLNRELTSFGTAAKAGLKQQIDLFDTGGGEPQELGGSRTSTVYENLLGEIQTEAARLEIARRRIRAVRSGNLDALTGGGSAPAGGPVGAGVGPAGVGPAGPGAEEQEWIDRLRQIRTSNMEYAHQQVIARIHDRYNIERREAEAAGKSIQLLERARMAELAAERRRFGKQEAEEKADQLREQRAAREPLAYELSRARIESRLSGPAKDTALRNLERERAMAAAGDDKTQQRWIADLFDLRGKMGVGDLGRAASPRGTFSGAALAAMGGGGGGPAERTAKGMERLVPIMSRIAGLTEDEILAIKQTVPRFS